MKLKTYRASTMSDALAKVKSDLGQSAVILHTKSYRAGGLLWFGRKNVVEITASDQAAVLPRRGAMPAPLAFEQPSSQVVLPSLRPAPPKAAIDAYKRASDDAAAMAPSARGPAPVFEATTTPSPETPTQPAASMLAEPASAAVFSEGSSAPTLMPVRTSRRETPRTTTPFAPVDGPAATVLQRELSEIKLLVNQVLQASPAACGPGAALPEALFEMYVRLLESQVSREIADAVVGGVRDELSPAEMADPQIVHEALVRRLGSLIPVAQSIPAPARSPDGRPRTIALIGPTGVGKTTTTAKLAAAYKLRHGRSVGLITSDTYRIAAVDQLRTYASIIGLPLVVVLTPGEMAAAVESLSHCDVILIDTAGRSQNNTERLTELREFLAVADPHETHLVLSTASSEQVLLRSMEAFLPVGPNRVLFSKLDEAVNFGVLVNVIHRVRALGLDPSRASDGSPDSPRIALSYITTGQDVPDHIEPGNSERLARMILENKLPDDALDSFANRVRTRARTQETGTGVPA